jgi:hypothetical protein
MPTLGQDFLKLKRLKDEHEAKAKAKDKAEAAMKKWQAHCFERAAAEGVEGHKTRGYLFTPVAKEFATIQDRAAFLEWAKSHDEDLVQETERKADLNTLVRRCLDDGEELPPGVGYYTREYVSVRSA